MPAQRSITLNFRIHINRKTLSWGLVAFGAYASVYSLFSDTLTMTAYYPSPQGVYWKLWSTADTILGRDQLTTSAPAVVQIGGDSVKGKYNTATSVLTVYGNTTLAKNPSIPATPTGNLAVQGTLVIPTVNAGENCSGGAVQSDGNGNLFACKNGQWTAAGGSVPTGTILTMSGSSCPSGYTETMAYYPSTTCSNNASDWNAGCSYSGYDDRCTAPATPGWYTTAPVCYYSGFTMVGAYSCTNPNGPNGCCPSGATVYGANGITEWCCGPKLTCTAAATEVQCKKN